MNIDLAGKKAVVAGGSRGIGRAIALTLPRPGQVFRSARGAPRHWPRPARTSPGSGIKRMPRVCDLADAAAIPRYIEEAARALGGIDILVNNASGFGTSDDEAGWAVSISVDLMATVRATRAALPYIEKSEAGSIINISSISGFRASARTPPYGAVKAAILEYTQTSAAQFARKQSASTASLPARSNFRAAPGSARKTTTRPSTPRSCAAFRLEGWAGRRKWRGSHCSLLAARRLGHRPEHRGRWRPDAVKREAPATLRLGHVVSLPSSAGVNSPRNSPSQGSYFSIARPRSGRSADAPAICWRCAPVGVAFRLQDRRGPSRGRKRRSSRLAVPSGSAVRSS